MEMDSVVKATICGENEYEQVAKRELLVDILERRSKIGGAAVLFAFARRAKLYCTLALALTRKVDEVATSYWHPIGV